MQGHLKKKTVMYTLSPSFIRKVLKFEQNLKV